MTLYPAQVDTTISLPKSVDNTTPVSASVVNKLREAIIAVEGELGPKPSGIYGNVRNRFDALESVITALNGSAEVIINTPTFTGDLSGNLLLQNVIGFYGRPLASTVPNFGDVYIWDGYEWATGSPMSSFTFAGDLSGNSTSQTVVGIQDRDIAATAPTNGQVLTWDAGNAWWEPATPTGGGGSVVFAGDLTGNDTNQVVVGLQETPVSSTTPSSNNALLFDGAEWSPQQLTLDPELIGPAFAITLNSSTLIEVGDTSINPSFTATKNYNATSALLTNNDNSESKNVLTQFNAGSAFTSDQNYTKSTYGESVLFTLTAMKGAITRTSNATYFWTQKFFYGLSSNATGNTEGFVEGLSTSDLVSSRARTISINITAGNYLYISYRTAYGAATFIDGNTNLGFDMTLISTTVSITNAFGFTENYTVYRTSNHSLGSSILIIS